jgi:hypothetical protein
VARQLRAARGSDGLLLVAVSGLQRVAAVDCPLEPTFDFHLVKPVHAVRLYTLLAEFAGRSRELVGVAG